MEETNTMLQINSGKLFKRGVGRSNHLRGVLHTNLRFGFEEKIETVAGELLPTSTIHNSLSLVYELTEQIEAQAVGPGVLVSHGIEPYLQDFGAVTSFVLNATCTPSYDLARRLTSGQRGLATHNAPQKLIKRVFDEQVWCQQHEAEQLVDFVQQLIGLERKTYLAVMRSIRTYVTGMHRIADDLELAYTLLVASIESLAQDFDGHRPNWQDYDEKKRHTIDKALVGADHGTIDRVREALLEVEHTSLARRFRDFALSHIKPSYFREETSAVDLPVGRSDLASVLNQAYRLRSGYIHNLQELPKILTLGHSYNETVCVNRTPYFTLQGLSRLARHVINEFLYRQSVVATESYDYSLERAGVVQLPMAPEYWVGRADKVNASDGRVRLEGFLEQLTAHVLGVQNATITDLRPVLEKVETIFPNMKAKDRRPFIALYYLFNLLAIPESKMVTFEKIINNYGKELDQPSSESLIVHVITGQPTTWDISSHSQTLEDYFRLRDRMSGLRVTQVIETAMVLTLAERYRILGNIGDAKKCLSLAVENFPGHNRLAQFEEEYDGQSPIDWKTLVLPNSSGSQAGQG